MIVLGTQPWLCAACQMARIIFPGLCNHFTQLFVTRMKIQHIWKNTLWFVRTEQCFPGRLRERLQLSVLDYTVLVSSLSVERVSGRYNRACPHYKLTSRSLNSLAGHWKRKRNCLMWNCWLHWQYNNKNALSLCTTSTKIYVFQGNWACRSMRTQQDVPLSGFWPDSLTTAIRVQLITIRMTTVLTKTGPSPTGPRQLTSCWSSTLL